MMGTYRLALSSFALATALLAGMTATSSAGQYHIYSCTDPVTQAPLPTDGWAETPGLSFKTENNCATGQPMTAFATPPGIPKAASSWTFTAPKGARIVAATLYREVDSGYRSRAFWAAPENLENLADDFDVCEGSETAECTRGNVNVYRECKTTSLCPPVSYAADKLVVPSNHLPAQHLAFDLICLTQGCYGYERLYSDDIVLEQATGPTAVATAGSLTTATTLRGVVDVSITASDPTSGVFQAILQVDGKVFDKQVIDANGGRCNQYGQEPDGSYIFLYTQPCPQAVSNVDVPFDTSNIPEGPHQISVLVSDAAGNMTTILTRSVTIENSGAYALRVQREQQAQALAARGVCNGECDDHARLFSANESTLKHAIRRSYSRSAFTLTGQLLNHDGKPMGGADVELRQRPVAAGASERLVARATTNAKGYWKLRAPKGPSRVLTVGYRSYSNDPTYATELQYHELVHASVRLTAPRRAQPGKTFTFHGYLAGGYIPSSGVLVSLEIYYDRKWREIALLRAERRGVFHYSYTFAAIGVATYRFRAELPSTVGYPFASGASKPTDIKLTG